ncbi:tripartite tricarboxylate transporter substrate binding protein [Thiomonas sp.]|jgi:tripartite-type tricarboxylate transporter receptor subunit TctC|uniref:Bug family tripartite tricarboxylate transporter substrate binding protein n=1 Tax=Thiomonas sp. TaxID=2047785 RepID=UPI0026214930|nr:tripartite tricarboxylate transporter substrate binding protein [Thiomonas sp.]
MHRKPWRAAAAALGLIGALSGAPSHAAGFPDRTLTIVVPFAPGGGVDMIGRVLAQQMSKETGQTVLVDDRPGASANLGAGYVARAKPDGYTILLAANGLAANATLFPDAPFDPLKDFVPVGKVGEAPLVVIVSQKSRFENLRQLLDEARAHPGKLTFGSAGNGSSQHLAGELLKMDAHIQALHVPYKGGAPATTDLLGGRIDFMVQNPLEALPLLRSHQLRALAVASDQRLKLLPDVPTAAQAGLPGYEASVWWGVVAPARTPAPVVRKLNELLDQALNDPATKARLESMGVVVQAGTRGQFGSFLHGEVFKWRKVIQTAHIHVN